MDGLSTGEDGAGGGCTVEGASGISCGAWDCAVFELWLFVDWPDCDWPDCARPVDTIRTSAAMRTSPTAASCIRANLNHNHRSLLLRSAIRPLLKRLHSGRLVEKKHFPHSFGCRNCPIWCI
jgi:hypothetical protein